MGKKTGIHRRLQRKAAGRQGQVEVPVDGILDVRTPSKAMEIERTGSTERIEKALERLAKSRRPHKILRVPNGDLAKACRIVRKRKVKVTVSNLGGTTHRYPYKR